MNQNERRGPGLGLLLLIPIGVSVAMPSITNPMCPTEENAIRRFRSRCARHASAA